VCLGDTPKAGEAAFMNAASPAFGLLAARFRRLPVSMITDVFLEFLWYPLDGISLYIALNSKKVYEV
jgi:hypothetical protein